MSKAISFTEDEVAKRVLENEGFDTFTHKDILRDEISNMDDIEVCELVIELARKAYKMGK